MRYFIKGGTIVDPAGEYNGPGDLLIEDGKIAAVAKSLTVDDAEVVSAKGKLLMPGLIDLHCHLREPGREDKETVASGARAAVKGGFTAVACMANTNPAADNAVIIEFILKQAKTADWAKVYPVGAVTKGLQGVELAEMGEMAAAGAVAFSDDGKTLMNPAVLRSAMEYSTLFELPLLLHEEDPELAGNGVMHEGYWSTVLGLPGIPAAAETVIIARDLLLAELTGAKVHCCHLSAGEAVTLVAAAKKRGVKVSAEATPHHLSLTDATIENYDPAFRVSPPLRAEQDRDALRQGLKDGVIDAIATDHAPHTLEEKHREFSLALTGMIGLETALGVIWTDLVQAGWLTREQLVERMAVAPARILKRPGGRLNPGDPADLLIFDPTAEWEVRREEITSKSKNSPFLGRKLQGRVEAVWVNGNVKLKDGELVE
jgi:dihydroorotase